MGWKKTTLGEVITLQRGFDLPSQNRIEGEIPVVSSSGISGFHNIAKVTGPGVVTGRYGTLGEVFYIEGDFWPLNTSLFVIDFKENHRRFIAYFLKNILKNLTSDKAAVPGVNRKDLHAKTIFFPEYFTQQRIADILSKYDDLIENNRRRIQLLEEAARLLYQEWFVRLRFPGHEHTKIVDGVPEGWQLCKIADICETIGGGTPSTKKPEYWDGNVVWATPTDITKNDCLYLPDTERKITQLGLKNSSAKTVPAGTILMTSRASIGFFGIMDKETSTNQGFINIIPYNAWNKWYITYNLMSRVEEIRSNASGSTYKEISKGRFREMSIVLPSKTVASEFYDQCNKLFELTRNLKNQQIKLQEARDLLLPRLMNGVIPV